MSEFVISIWDNEHAYADYTPQQWGEVFAAHATFADTVARLGGTVVHGKALQPTATGRAIRGGTTVTDGPYVELREPFCGWYVIEARDLDHATEIAEHTPAKFGGVEVRPVMPTPTA